MQFLKGKHLPFAIVGFSTLLIYNLLPLGLILVYSFRTTQILLHCFPTCFNNALHPFMDNILGCYKDGTNGTLNCRYFAIVYHIARIALFVSFTTTRSLYYYPVILYTCIVTGLLVVIIQPYKSAVYNTLDATLLFSLALGIVGVSAYLVAGHNDPKNSENANTQLLLQWQFLCSLSGVPLLQDLHFRETVTNNMSQEKNPAPVSVSTQVAPGWDEQKECRDG